MLDANQILKLLPNIDCGLCRNPSCATLARKISRDIQAVEECPLITPENQNRIHQLIDSNIPKPENKTESVNGYYDEEILEITPCAEYGRVTLEAHLTRPNNSVFDLFDSCDMCLSFSNIKSLENVKCSLEMGYGLAEKDDRRIHVFKTGKIMIRRAMDRTDAMNTMKLITSSLGPSIICSCGNSLADCLSGGCEDCYSSIDDGQRWLFGSHEYSVKPAGELLKPIFEHFKVHQDKSEIPPYGKEEDMKLLALAWQTLNRLTQNLVALDSFVKANKFEELESYRDTLYENLREVSKYSNQLLVKELDHKPNTEALIFLGLIKNLRRIIDAFLSFKDKPKTPDWSQFYPVASSILFDGIKSFYFNDDTLAEAVRENFNKNVSNWQEVLKAKNYPLDLVNLYKIAINGYNISRIMKIPVAV
jgi:ArsR family metal-binding transcriptional regulator